MELCQNTDVELLCSVAQVNVSILNKYAAQAFDHGVSS